jgi:hypothetical protein
MLRSVAARAILVLLALGAGGSSLRGQNPVVAHVGGGAIEGLVYDSTSSGPLSEARVFLWNTSLFATTDSVGHFSIVDVPAGEHSLVFFHPRLTSLGVSSGRTPVRVAESDHVSVALATPSMLTIRSLLCELEDPGQASGRAIGYVGDASTGIPLQGANVLLTWSEDTPEGSRTATRQATVDTDGWYSFCSLPAGVEIDGVAYFYGQETNKLSFRLPLDAPARLDYRLGEARPGSVAGVLRDADTEGAISEAEITLAGSDLVTVTDAKGRFLIEDVPPGTYELQTQHLAYGRRADALQIAPGRDLHIEVEMATRPIELAPIRVTVQSKAEAQALAVGGRLVSRQVIDEVRSRSQDMGDLLTHANTPGLVVHRGGPNVCVGFRRGQVTMQRGGGCQPAQVYINDVPTSDPMIAMNLAPEVIDRVILVSPVEAGVLYGRSSAAGVILVYTRSR